MDRGVSARGGGFNINPAVKRPPREPRPCHLGYLAKMEFFVLSYFLRIFRSDECEKWILHKISHRLRGPFFSDSIFLMKKNVEKIFLKIFDVQKKNEKF